jgi:hypothetical protein
MLIELVVLDLLSLMISLSNINLKENKRLKIRIELIAYSESGIRKKILVLTFLLNSQLMAHLKNFS